MTLESGIVIPAEKIAEICRKYCIREMSVFGSAARGNMGQESDVDILVDFFPGVVHGWDYFGIEAELSETFGRSVDVATKKWLRPGVRDRILPEAHVIYAI
jgi:hypothetical protein